MMQLSEQTGRDRIGHAVHRRPPIARQVERSKQQVPDWEDRCVVRVARFRLVGVVPVMELRRGKKLLHRPQTPVHVGMKEQRGEELDQQQHPGQLRREAGRHQQDERWTEEGTIERVRPEAADPIELFGRVVDRVESP